MKHLFILIGLFASCSLCNPLRAQYDLDYMHILHPDSFKANFKFYDQSTAVAISTHP